MPFTFLVGGARSGKSRLAVDLAALSGAEVLFVATATPDDADMAARIAEHRTQRPETWLTVEEPVDAAGVAAAADPTVYVVLDCLTLWVSNLMERGHTNREVLDSAGSLIRVLSTRPGSGAVVSNEVGSGIVPATGSGRRFRDLLGRVNLIAAGAADRSYLVVAGKGLALGEVGA